MLEGFAKMNLFKIVNFTRVGYTVFGMVYLSSGIFINFIQLILYILVRPICKPLFRWLNYYLSYTLYSQIVFLLQYWANVRVTLHAKKGDFENYFGKEQAFLIMNHSHEIDWMIGWILCDGCCILGNVKTFAKKSLQYLPTLGYSWKLGGSIFVERNWKKDQKVCETKLKELTRYKEPIWLLLAAEGTRFTPEKHAISKEFAKKNDLPILRYHLTPRTKGFTTSIPIVRNKMAAIYNVNGGIKEEGVKPTLTNILLGKSINADFFVERIPMEDLPEGEAKLADWLHKLYKRKDDLIHNYVTTGNWLPDSNDDEYESIPLPRRLAPAVNFSFWFFTVVVPFVVYVIEAIMTRDILGLTTALATSGCFIYVLDRLMEQTQITSASSYGSEKTQ